MLFPARMPKGPRLKAGGIGQYFEGPNLTGKMIENYESTCAHCAHISSFPSKRKMMDYVDICRGCMRLICLRCIGKPCVPQEKECERIEHEARLKARIERGSWGCY